MAIPTGERLARVEQKVDDLKQTMEDFIKSADHKYAQKWVEKLMWLLVTALISILVYMLSGRHTI